MSLMYQISKNIRYSWKLRIYKRAQSEKIAKKKLKNRKYNILLDSNYKNKILCYLPLLIVEKKIDFLQWCLNC